MFVFFLKFCNLDLKVLESLREVSSVALKRVKESKDKVQKVNKQQDQLQVSKHIFIYDIACVASLFFSILMIEALARLLNIPSSHFCISVSFTYHHFCLWYQLPLPRTSVLCFFFCKSLGDFFPLISFYLYVVKFCNQMSMTTSGSWTLTEWNAILSSGDHPAQLIWLDQSHNIIALIIHPRLLCSMTKTTVI